MYICTHACAKAYLHRGLLGFMNGNLYAVQLAGWKTKCMLGRMYVGGYHVWKGSMSSTCERVRDVSTRRMCKLVQGMLCANTSNHHLLNVMKAGWHRYVNLVQYNR